MQKKKSNFAIATFCQTFPTTVKNLFHSNLIFTTKFQFRSHPLSYSFIYTRRYMYKNVSVALRIYMTEGGKKIYVSKIKCHKFSSNFGRYIVYFIVHNSSFILTCHFYPINPRIDLKYSKFHFSFYMKKKKRVFVKIKIIFNIKNIIK